MVAKVMEAEGTNLHPHLYTGSFLPAHGAWAALKSP